MTMSQESSKLPVVNLVKGSHFTDAAKACLEFATFEDGSARHRFCDLVFICRGGKRVGAHGPILAPRSAHLRTILEGRSGAAKEIGEEVVISLDKVEADILRSLMEIVYQGQTVLVGSRQVEELRALHAILGFDFPLTEGSGESTSKPPTETSRKPGPKSRISTPSILAANRGQRQGQSSKQGPSPGPASKKRRVEDLAERPGTPADNNGGQALSAAAKPSSPVARTAESSGLDKVKTSRSSARPAPMSIKIKKGLERSSPRTGGGEENEEKKPPAKAGGTFKTVALLKCNFCGQVYLDQSTLDEHVRDEHVQVMVAEPEVGKEAKGASSSPEEKKKKSQEKIQNERRNRAKVLSSDLDSSDDEGKAKARSKPDGVVTTPLMPKIRKPGPASKTGGQKASIASKQSSNPLFRPLFSTPATSKKVELLSSLSSSSCDEGSAVKNSDGSKRKFKLKLQSPKASGGSSSSKKASKSSAAASHHESPSGKDLADKGSGGSDVLRQCCFCPDILEKRKMKNHTINHFKQDLFKMLPSFLPFACPVCASPSRDRISLMRHYGFTHKAVFEYCSKADMEGKPVGQGSVATEKRSRKRSSDRKGSHADCEKPAGKKGVKSKAILDSSSDEDDDDDDKDGGRKSGKSAAASSNGKPQDDVQKVDDDQGTNQETCVKIEHDSGGDRVNFTDSDSDAFVSSKRSAEEAINLFDSIL